MRILLITGGDSSEREVSLSSASNVKSVLEKNGHKVYLYDLLKGHNGLRRIANSYDILFPVLHGEEGEGGILHKYLVGLGKPIVGTRNYKGLKEAWLKIPFKEYCDKNGIQTPRWKKIEDKQDILDFGLPCVLKASAGGSSKEVALIDSESDFANEDVKRIMKLPGLFLEEKISGTEVTVGTLNDRVLPIIEIVPTKHGWFSYDAKYDSTTKEIPFAPSVDSQTQAKLGEITMKIRNDFDLGSYLRVDYIGSGSEFYALDVNTIVGLTAGSLYPKMGKAIGMDFGQVLNALLKSAK